MNDQTLLDPTQEIKSYKELLVGEGRKFKDDEALAKGKYLSDSYIKILEAQLDRANDVIAESRDRGRAEASLEDLLDQVDKQKQLNAGIPPQKPVVTEPKIDPNQFKDIAKATFAEMQKEGIEQENFKMVRDKLIERYGPDYSKSVSPLIEDLNISSADFDSLARKNPRLLMKTLGMDTTTNRQQFQSPPRSEFRPANVKTEQSRDYAYYQGLMKKDYKAFLGNHKLNVQMHKDLQTMGPEAFYGDEYNAEDF